MKFFKSIFKVIFIAAITSLSIAAEALPFTIDNEKAIDEKKYSSIHETSTLNQVKDFASKTKPDIIVFDIDETLITLVDAISISQIGVYKFKRNLKKEYNLKNDEASFLISLILSTSDYKLMEEKIDVILEDLANYSPNIIALTACGTGAFGQIDNVEKWKTNLIKEHGIKFPNHNFNAFNQMRFDELLDQSQKKKKIQYPIFINGILYTGKHVSKGTLLKAFLKKAQFIPNKILIVDDLKRNLEDIKTVFQDTNIEFILLHYKPTDQIIIDDKVVDIQMKILVEEQRWVNDTEALEYLKNFPTL